MCGWRKAFFLKIFFGIIFILTGILGINFQLGGPLGFWSATIMEGRKTIIQHSTLKLKMESKYLIVRKRENGNDPSTDVVAKRLPSLSQPSKTAKERMEGKMNTFAAGVHHKLENYAVEHEKRQYVIENMWVDRFWTFVDLWMQNVFLDLILYNCLPVSTFRTANQSLTVQEKNLRQQLDLVWLK